jgi:hypothetical protein
MGDGIWRAARLDTGGPDAKQGPGWYATRTPVPAEPVAGEKRGLIVTYVGPFDGEAAARAYCDERNPPGASSAPRDAMHEAGRRSALAREEAALRTILGDDP